MTQNHETRIVPTVDVITSTTAPDGTTDNTDAVYWRTRIAHPSRPPMHMPAYNEQHAERQAAALRGMLAHAYHAGRADQAEKVRAMLELAADMPGLADALELIRIALLPDTTSSDR